MPTAGLAHVEDGRTIAFAKGISVPLTIQKANGAFTYDTSDLAALKHRVQEEKGEWLIYVVDSGQSLHFQTVFDVARRAGYFNESNTRINHVEFGVVLGEDKKKFKSREGNTVRLVELLDEGIERSRQRLIESNRHQVGFNGEIANIRVEGIIRVKMRGIDRLIEDTRWREIDRLIEDTRWREIDRLVEDTR